MAKIIEWVFNIMVVGFIMVVVIILGTLIADQALKFYVQNYRLPAPKSGEALQ